MKKIILTSVLIFTALLVSSAQEKGIIAEVLRKSVECKVDSMQELIGFDDDKAKQLKDMELQYLLDVQKAETCFLCSTKRRIAILKEIRDNHLQEILTRKQYIEYEGGDFDKVKKYPVRAR